MVIITNDWQIRANWADTAETTVLEKGVGSESGTFYKTHRNDVKLT